MSSSFSDKPYTPRRPTEAGDDPIDSLPLARPEPRLRFNFRKLLVGIALLLAVIGVLLLCFIRGGFAQPHRGWDGRPYLEMNEPGHIIGFVLVGLSAVIGIILFSFEKRP